MAWLDPDGTVVVHVSARPDAEIATTNTTPSHRRYGLLAQHAVASGS